MGLALLILHSPASRTPYVLAWAICECGAKLWSRRGLGQGRNWRTGGTTSGDCP